MPGSCCRRLLAVKEHSNSRAAELLGSPDERFGARRCPTMGRATSRLCPRRQRENGPQYLASAGAPTASLTRFKLWKDPHFVDKLRDVVGLYLNPPRKRLCSASTRKAGSKRWTGRGPCCRCAPACQSGRRMTTSGTARRACTPPSACSTASSLASAGRSATRKRLSAFSTRLRRRHPTGTRFKSSSNLSMHKSPWLKRHPGVHFHFIPTSSSWLNLMNAGPAKSRAIGSAAARSTACPRSWPPSTSTCSSTTRRPVASSGRRAGT